MLAALDRLEHGRRSVMDKGAARRGPSGNAFENSAGGSAAPHLFEAAIPHMVERQVFRRRRLNEQLLQCMFSEYKPYPLCNLALFMEPAALPSRCSPRLQVPFDRVSIALISVLTPLPCLMRYYCMDSLS